MRSVHHSSPKIESLEDRRMFALPGGSGGETTVAPDSGVDIHILSNQSDDTTVAVSTSSDPFKRVPLPGGFQWFDSTSNRDLINRGGELEYILVDGWNFWPRDTIVGAIRTGDPSEENTRSFVNYAATLSDILVIDIEEWAMDIRFYSQAQVNQNIQRFKNIISWVRDEQPNLKIGIYSLFPVSDLYATVQYQVYSEIAVDPVAGAWYRGALPGEANGFAKLQNSDAYLYELSQQVDYVFPAIYSSSPDMELWTRYAKGSIYEARRYGKPVIPFLMPTYHHASVAMEGRVVPPEMWQAQLNLMPQIADGAIIWTDPYAPTGVDEYWITIAINTVNSFSPRGASLNASDVGRSLPGLSSTDRASYFLLDEDEDAEFDLTLAELA